MLKRLIVLSVFIVGTVAVAHATPISGSFAINGNDGFDSSHITFGTAAVGGVPLGTFTGMTGAVTMLPTFPVGTALPYASGFQTVLARTGFANIEVMTNTTGSRVTDFFMVDYTATLFSLGQSSCMVFQCLVISGNGFFTESGFDQTPGTFTFTTQESADELAAYEASGLTLADTTFSATGIASPIPEPGSLVLLGTGILGLAGVARRKLIGA